MKFTSISLLTFTFLKSFAYAKLSGSHNITPNDYIGLPKEGLLNNPPACEMPYSTLDLGRIVAVQALDKSTDCNKCLKIVNDQGDYVYALAVDLGGQGLDLSTPSFKALFGQQWDASPATWSQTDYSNCKGIYDPKGHPTIVTPKKISGSKNGNGVGNGNDRPVEKPTPTKSVSNPNKKPTSTPTKKKATLSPPKNSNKNSKKVTNPKNSKDNKNNKNNKNKKNNKNNKNKKNNKDKKRPSKPSKSKPTKKYTTPKKCTRCNVHHQSHHRHVRYVYSNEY